MDNLETYNRKRDFQRTPEPKGRVPKSKNRSGGQFVIQKHAARRLHYDLRLERDGVFKSWAVPKGPSLDPGEKRLAVEVEDHPLDYGDFEGVIPAKQYGAGTVMLWDRGRWQPAPGSKHKDDEDHLDFVLDGEKLKGAWSLVRMRGPAGEDGKNWLLIKRSDKSNGAALSESKISDVSVATGRTMKQIAADKKSPSSRPTEDIASAPVLDVSKLPGAKRKALSKSPTPQLASLASEAPGGDNWLHEIKFDGYRLLARCDAGAVALLTRNGKDWTRRFPAITAALESLSVKQALLDGELVALDSGGTSSFRALQAALSAGTTANLVYQVFDLLYLNGYDLKAVPLESRKEALEQLLLASGFTASDSVRYSQHIQGQGPAVAENACRLGLEGILSKRADRSYSPGRSRDWLKVKCTAQEELIICGYTEPGGTRIGFGALLLGAWDDDQLIYMGKVGTGFDNRLLKRLHKQLRELETEQSPFAEPLDEPGLHWVRPELVAQIEFTEWTGEALRHPVFLGLREDKEARDIHLPEEMKRMNSQKNTARSAPATDNTRPTARNKARVAGVTLTNPGRVLYPDQGVTKLALAQYYEEVEEWLLPQLAYRPLSLVRCPAGQDKQCFFQKHPRSSLAKDTPRIRIEESEGSGNYLYVKQLSDVIALVQAGVLELHVWGSRIDAVEQPDQLVFDLDPAPDVAFPQLLSVARALRDRLADLGLNSFPRVTGGKGLHLVVPIVPQLQWDQVKAFSHAVARLHAADDSSNLTTNMSKAKRRGRIFLDYLRNGRGATAICSYSTRARDGAPVAVPLTWDELNAAMRPDRYNVENLRRRLAALKTDPWQDFESARRPLTASLLKAVGLKEGKPE